VLGQRVILEEVELSEIRNGYPFLAMGNLLEAGELEPRAVH